MRRTVIALVLTAIGLYLVLSFKSRPLASSAVQATGPNTTAAPAGTADQAGQPPAGAGPAGSGTSTTAPAAAGSARTVTGPVVGTRYGDVQVAVVLAGTRITDVKPLQLPFDRARSQSISEQVAPILQQEVLDAQSAQIDTVSGATYTSEAYAQSLQAALDQARAG